MGLFSFQILIVNFVVAVLIAVVSYFINRRIRVIHPVLLFIISSIGTFLGTVVGVMIPLFTFTFDSLFINNILLFIPGVMISTLFIYIWSKGSRSKGYI